MKNTLIFMILILTVISFSVKSYSINENQKKEDFGKIKNLGVYVGMWAYDCIYIGSKDTSCERLVKNIKFCLYDLDILSIPDKLACQRLQGDSVYQILHLIAQSVNVKKGVISQNYFYYKCFIELAVLSIANIAIQKDLMQKDKITYLSLLSFGFSNIDYAIKTSRNMQVPDSVIQTGVKINDELISLIDIDKNSHPDFGAYITKLAEWVERVDKYVQTKYFAENPPLQSNTYTSITFTVTSRYNFNNADFEVSCDSKSVKKVKETIERLAKDLDLSKESDRTVFLKRYKEEIVANPELKYATIKSPQINELESIH